MTQLPHYISTPPYDSPKKASKLAYVQDGLALPVQSIPVPRKKREQTLAHEPHSQPTIPRHAPRPNHTLRILSDAYSTFTRSRRKSRH